MARVYLAHMKKDDLNRKNGAPQAQSLSEHLRHVAGLMSASAEAAGLSSTYHPFTVLNMGVTHKLRDGLSVQFAVNNLLNRNFDRTTSVSGTSYNVYYDDLDADGIAGGSYMSRRSYWLGLTYDF